MEVTRVGGSLGARITGVQLGDGFDGDVAEELRRALDEHLVVNLPGQELSRDGLEELTDQLGGRDVTPYVDALEDRPYVIKVIKEPGDALNFANAWHTDLSYLATPPRYTVLHAYDTPPAGGDTIWANQQAAYVTLSPGLQDVLGGLDAVHSAGTAYGTGGLLDRYGKLSSMAIRPSAEAYATETHPVVTRHPRTGRPSLFVNSHFAVNDYPGERREMYRTSVRGERPERFA